MRLSLPLLAALILAAAVCAQEAADADRKAAYVQAVTRGEGMLPWQEEHPSQAEKAFRAEMEARKDTLLADSDAAPHPVLYTPEDLERARENAEASDWAADWVARHVKTADYVVEQGKDWIHHMIPEEAPAQGYGFTCPNCVGTQSQEAVGYSLADWNYTQPDEIRCTACGHVYPSDEYPETAKLELPRLGDTISYYRNAKEKELDDYSGEHAYHWVGRPVHMSFSGLIRESKIKYMRGAARSLGFAYAFTGDPRYAAAARDLLVRFAVCFRHWPYRDYWDTYADCDPLYAAWHDMELPLGWKRHLSESAYAKDTAKRARMLQTYWGAGRVHPSTGSISGLSLLVLAYDLTCIAEEAGGEPVWSAEQRRIVERDLLVEYIMEAEPYVGGTGAADCSNNKCPRVYSAMASVAKCLGIKSLADTALRGYEVVRDKSFNSDGFSTESPSYNNMYLSQLLVIPEKLHGFRPAGGGERTDYYATDAKLRRMYRGVLWSLEQSGAYLPLSDTHVHTRPSSVITQMGLRRYPDLYAGAMPRLGANHMTQYALFHLTDEALEEDNFPALPETCFPDWQTAVLRHGDATVALPFNPHGGHRHRDNLALYFSAGGRALLGELGYVGDMPQNSWLRSTQSHNLVVVDDGEQEFGGRNPRFEMMATSPLASVAEASTDAYDQCSAYRRRVVLVKGKEGPFLVDRFHVRGGGKHAYRVYSEVAASDTENGELGFHGVDMPPEPPLPEVGQSLAREDIFGLRDVRTAAPEGPWKATWRDAEGAYSLCMLSPCDTVAAANGPGQRGRKDPGRRVRYVDAIREGEELESTFMAVHTPGGAGLQTKRLDAAAGGPRAMAVRVDAGDSRYLLLHDFETPAVVAGVRFQGTLAVLEMSGGATVRCMTVGAATLEAGQYAFENQVAAISGPADHRDDHALVFEDAPGAWPVVEDACTAYARVDTGNRVTGYPVASLSDGGVVAITGYPLGEVASAALPAVRYTAAQ
ncbi:MAG: heparinase II/III family protein [Candidatus Hydrogenedentota bacterium]